MNNSNESVRNYLDRVTPQKRRRDAETLLTMMARATGESPRLLGGTIIGFGQYHYKYASGREGGFGGCRVCTAHGCHDDLSDGRSRAIQGAAPTLGSAQHRRGLSVRQGSQ